MISWTAGPSLASLRSGELVTNNAAVDEFINNDVSQVAAGDDFACAISRGRLFCWGSNGNGRLGIGDTTNRFVPVTVSGQGKFLNTGNVSSISAGSQHVCAIDEGVLFCWGWNGSGRIGDGTTDNNKTRPTEVQSGGGTFTNSSVSSVATGDQHTCAIRNREAYCWGENQAGQLGIGNNNDSSNPVSVSANGEFRNRDVTQVAAGVSHSCAIETGHLYCWGSNTKGQVGTGSVGSSFLLPNLVSRAGDMKNSGEVSAVAVGFDYTCALESGDLFCWGTDDRSVLGRKSGTLIAGNPLPRKVDTALPFTNDAVARFDIGAHHSCAVENGKLFCWGWNNAGRLGVPAIPSNTSTPTPTQVSGSAVVSQFSGTAVSEIATGNTFTCAIDDGVVYCWGYNFFGQLGDGTSSSQSSPVRVSGGIAAPGPPTVVAGDGEVTVTWPRVGGVAEYTVTGSPAGTCTVSAPTTSCVISGLANNTPHSFTVVASLGSVTSSASTASLAIAPGEAAPPISEPVLVAPPPPVTESIGGDSASTQIALSRTTFQPDVSVVYLIRETDLVAGAAAGANGGPMFTFGPGGLDDSTLAEIRRLRPQRLMVIGESSSASIRAEDLLAALNGTPIERVGGTDRYDTAARIAALTHPGHANVVYVANGVVLADAVSGGPAAGLENAPVLLVRPLSIPKVTADELRRLKPDRIVVLGETDAISRDVERQLQEFAPKVERIGGSDRYATAVALSQQRFPFGARTVYLAIGADLALAGVAAPVATINRAPLLFSRSSCLLPDVRSEIRRLRPTRIVTLGKLEVADVLNLPDC